MPDAALMAIVRHFASRPPALVQASLMADGEPFLSAYESMADQQDRDFRTWLGGVAKVEHQARAAVAASPHDFTPQMFDEIADPFARHLRRQQRLTARLEHRSPLRMSFRMRRLRERTLARQRQAYEASSGLVDFLRELRAEVVARQLAEAAPSTWTPNETTVTAMTEAEAGGLPRFATVADLMTDLHADD